MLATLLPIRFLVDWEKWTCWNCQQS